MTEEASVNMVPQPSPLPAPALSPSPQTGQRRAASAPKSSNWTAFRARWRATAARVRAENADNNSWLTLADELAARLVEPRYSVSFVMYLFTGVVLLGGIAIWLEIVRYAVEAHGMKKGEPWPSLSGVLTAVHTFYPALAWSSTMQLVYGEKNDKWLKAVAIGFGSVTLLMAVFAMALAGVWLAVTSMVVGVLGTLIAIFLWWIANAPDPNLKDLLPKTVGMGAKGGAIEPDTALPGSTQGFDFGGQS